MTLTRRLIWIVAVFVVVETVLVGLVVLNEDAERVIREGSSNVAEVWFGADETEGLLAAYADLAGTRFDDWIRPLWAAPQPPPPDKDFGDCLACHVGFWEQPRFGPLYFDHRTHHEARIDCRICHIDSKHPNPPTPSEQTCATCHPETNTPGECNFCHAPGTLNHPERMGVEGDEPRDCIACHLPGNLENPSGEHLTQHSQFDGADFVPCSACHSTEQCSACHEPGHADGWIFEHGPVLYEGDGGDCLSCHGGSFCSACHGGAPKQPLPMVWPSQDGITP